MTTYPCSQASPIFTLWNMFTIIHEWEGIHHSSECTLSTWEQFLTIKLSSFNYANIYSRASRGLFETMAFWSMTTSPISTTLHYNRCVLWDKSFLLPVSSCDSLVGNTSLWTGCLSTQIYRWITGMHALHSLKTCDEMWMHFKHVGRICY